MNLACVYAPSKKLGKRPRRRLDVGSGLSERSEAPNQAHGAYRSSDIEEYAPDSGSYNSTFDPILDIGITPPQDIQLPLLSETSFAFPPSGFDLWGDRHRCYHESNEVIQLLSIPERLFEDDAPIILDVAQILQATRRAINSLNRLVDCKCAKKRGHQAMLYASLISRALWWYREAAGDAVYQAAEATGIPSPNTSSENSVCIIL
jgi:hypothetical protein